MELWIRSQDRNALYCVRQLRINGLDIMCLGGEVLGTYKTRERAIEVLDEIQKLLQPMYKITNEFKKSEMTGNCQWIENQEYIPIQTKVYEMPKE